MVVGGFPKVTISQLCHTKGTFFWDYSVYLYSGIRHTEYQFPKEQTLCYSENRIADVTKNKAMRLSKSGYTIFPKDRQKLPKEHHYQLFCLLRTNCYSVNLSEAELMEYYSVHSGITIGAKRTKFRVFSFRNSPKRTCPNTEEMVDSC